MLSKPGNLFSPSESLNENSEVFSICCDMNAYSPSEMNLTVKDFTSDESAILQKLITETKTKVQEFRVQNDGLSNDTYNLIFENIKNWTFPLKEKLCALLKKYEEELSILTNSNVIINENSIKTFINYRNVITHSKFQVPNQDVAVIAHYMCGLIYCSILSRMGLPKDTLKNLCQYKLLR